jgi:histone H1/5
MPPAKKSTTKKAADGPKYSELIKAALVGLKERNGSSLAAIKKYLAANFPAAKNDLALKNALKFGVNKGMFIKVKASFKLSAEGVRRPPGTHGEGCQVGPGRRSRRS